MRSESDASTADGSTHSTTTTSTTTACLLQQAAVAATTAGYGGFEKDSKQKSELHRTTTVDAVTTRMATAEVDPSQVSRDTKTTNHHPSTSFHQRASAVVPTNQSKDATTTTMAAAFGAQKTSVPPPAFLPQQGHGCDAHRRPPPQQLQPPPPVTPTDGGYGQAAVASTAASSVSTSTTTRTRAKSFLRRLWHNHEELTAYDPDRLDMNFNNFTVLLADNNNYAGHDEADDRNNTSNNTTTTTTTTSELLIERVFQLRAELVAETGDGPVMVDVGYHYTKRSNLPYIASYGLLSKAERRFLNLSQQQQQQLSIGGTSAASAGNGSSMVNQHHHRRHVHPLPPPHHQPNNGGTFGDGIYTGNNPYSYHAFAGSDVCLLTARLKGVTATIKDDGDVLTGVAVSAAATTSNTILGRAGGSDEVCVLKSAAQCIPLVWFYSDLINLQASEDDHNDLGNTMVHQYHCSLQRIVDECFNNHPIYNHAIPNRMGFPYRAPATPPVVLTNVPRIRPSHVLLRQKAAVPMQPSTVQPTPPVTVAFAYQAPPETLRRCHTQDCVRTVPQHELPPFSSTTTTSSSSCANCAICWNPLRWSGNETAPPLPVVALHACGHVFHEPCIAASLQSMYSCPLCRARVGFPQGRSPSGTMTVLLQPTLHCLGHLGSGSISITYELPPGVQRPYHENPGVPFAGVRRVAYLPNTHEGRQLLKRLKFAFCHGLTFTVGTSLTTGVPNRITWASIHHKTSVFCGAHGYPDPNYFTNVNEELDRLHVPAADDL